MPKIIHKKLPRLPLDGNIDLTYRCNNHCRHCWLWVPDNTQNLNKELSFSELKDIVDQARSMGCQAWHISGGEPMLREDFYDVFDYITRKTVTYSLNTNGTLITPQIAQIMRRKGRKLVALYGATPEVHDNITRNQGSFEAMMRGIAYLKEAGAEFIVQIVPMKGNFHQFHQMVELAESVSKVQRVSAPWLWMSADRSSSRNREIAAQRLDPTDVVFLDKPSNKYLTAETLPKQSEENLPPSLELANCQGLCFTCISPRNEFFIDPYGKMSFCGFIKDPSLQYDLRVGTFREAWDEFIPSLAERDFANQEYHENCGSCDYRNDCRWCSVFSYLEHGRYTSKIDYLCEVTKYYQEYKEQVNLKYVRYFQNADITIKLSSDFPLIDARFDARFNVFETKGPSTDTISIHLASPVPQQTDLNLGSEVYRRPPWAIYKNRDAWVYLSTSDENNDQLYSVSIFNFDFSSGTIFIPPHFTETQGMSSLTTYPSDQILLAQVLADRQACIMHSSGIILNGQGFLFVGHSEAGKSTMMKLLRNHGEILCDDRNIIRKYPDGYRLFGSWSCGELPDVSAASAPLRAIFFLEKAATNEAIEITDNIDKFSRLLEHLVKALVTEEWWDKMFALAENIISDVPIYRLKFDKSGDVVNVLKPFFE